MTGQAMTRSDVAEPRERRVGSRRAPDPASGSGATPLTVFYDRDCELCRRCRAWLEAQPQLVPLRFVATDEATARALLPQLPWLGTELVVVADDGAAWVGPAAFLMCLWATARYRPWAFRLSTPALAPLAERFFVSVSSNRSRWARRPTDDPCTDGSCRHRDGGHAGPATSGPWPVPGPWTTPPPWPGRER